MRPFQKIVTEIDLEIRRHLKKHKNICTTEECCLQIAWYRETLVQHYLMNLTVKYYWYFIIYEGIAKSSWTNALIFLFVHIIAWYFLCRYIKSYAQRCKISNWLLKIFETWRLLWKRYVGLTAAEAKMRFSCPVFGQDNGPRRLEESRKFMIITWCLFYVVI